MDGLPGHGPGLTRRWRFISGSQGLLRIVAAIFFIGAGCNHFVNPHFYREIVPPGLGSPAALVSASGVAEIAGGVGLLIRPMRRVAGWGLIALLVAVFPANIYMAVYPDRIADLHISRWMLWARLPLQGLFILWVWWSAISRRAADQDAADVAVVG